MNLRPLALLLVAAILGGCATSTEFKREELATRYVMTKGGFNEWLAIVLKADGSYVLDHAMFACVIGLNGEMPMFYGREEGTWSIDGGLLHFVPRARTPDFMEAAVFIPTHVQRLEPKRDGRTRLLISSDHSEYLVIREDSKISFPFFDSGASTMSR